MNPSDLLAFVRAHWKMIVAALYVLSNVAVAVTPKRFQEEKWWGLLLALARWAGTHVHADEPGTLKLPFTSRALAFGGGARPASAQPTTDPAPPPVVDHGANTKPPPGAS